ncbi:winged helix-turn-helix transcriptional regulator [Natronocalculus amylovorans]|uniref:Helix-turn-helix domain-containing protein n=1 Tax=Natronocalculus amylovorans TaxID=2917812 RepID=A0AAE3FZF0_9EURY|nr:winged helix-turn-helix transcriptional regulator [Natronocalculus amylovorans]MCL9818010.1 helix-turn-helix domain-containing protein [Natronocalculus amylovorans]
MIQQEIQQLPPSAKLVLKILEWNGEQTQKSLAEESLLAPRTVRSALDELSSLGIIEEDIFIPDARKRVYSLSQGYNDLIEPTSRSRT